MTDSEFLAAFESCSIPERQWNHRAHVRVAYLYSMRYDLALATERMRSGIKALNATNGVPEAIDMGYHETLTSAFMQLIYAATHGPSRYESSDAFCDDHPELLDKRVLLKFYSRERIMTMQAKTSFVKPDLAALPQVPEDSYSDVDVADGITLDDVLKQQPQSPNG